MGQETFQSQSGRGWIEEEALNCTTENYQFSKFAIRELEGKNLEVAWLLVKEERNIFELEQALVVF